MITIRFLLLLCAFLCFVFSALGVPSSRVNLLAAGLAFWMLTLLIV